ncbi:unnamed protein product [Sphagnum balticum]
MAWGNAVAVRSAFLEGLPYTFVPFTLTNENLAYTAHDGDAQLIEITRKVIERQVGTTYRHVFLTNGATGGCTIALRAMGWAGYKTVITRQPPYFPIYPAIIKAANMDHVYENPEFCTDNSVILFDSPSNPYGEIEHAIYLPNRPIVHDAVYHSRVYALNLKPLPCSIVVGSYSKLTGLNGLRTGWVATNDGGLAMHLKSLVEAEYCGLSSASTLVLLTALKEYRTKTAWEDLQKQIVKLQEDLAISEQNLKDFEGLALTWQKSYQDLDKKYKRDIGNAQQTIDQLQEELDQLKE